MIVNSTRIVQSHNIPEPIPNEIISDFLVFDYEKFEIVEAIEHDAKNIRKPRINNRLRHGPPPIQVLGRTGVVTMNNPADVWNNFVDGVTDTFKNIGKDILGAVIDGLFSSRRVNSHDPIMNLWALYLSDNEFDNFRFLGEHKDLYIKSVDGSKTNTNTWSPFGLPWREMETSRTRESDNAHVTMEYLSYKNNFRAWRNWMDSSRKHMYNPIQFKDNAEKPKGTEQNTPHRNRSHTANKTLVQLMHSIGSDFMQNKFDAFLVWDFMGENPFDSVGLLDKLTENEDKWLTDFEKYILSRKGFAVRFCDITVPPISNEDYVLPFLQTSVHKMRTTKKMSNQASFSFRLDQHLIWLDKISEMTNRKNGIDETFALHVQNHPYFKGPPKKSPIADNTEKLYNWRIILKALTKSWPKESKGGYRLKSAKLSLVIKMVHLSNWLNPHYQHPVLPYIVFDDIRILGTSDAIEYNRNSPDIQKIKVNFIYKRQYQINQGFIKSDADKTPEFGLTTNNSKGKLSPEFNRVEHELRSWSYPEPHYDLFIPQIPIHAPLLDWSNVSVYATRMDVEVPAIRGIDYDSKQR